MADIIRLGVVGVRNIGKGHIHRAVDVPGCKVVAAADTDMARLATVRADLGVERLYSSATELFADPQVDAVVLALPNMLHAPLTIEALEAGKHVLVEKPICRTTAEADAMIAARDRTGLTLMVGMNQRYKPLHYAIRKAIQDGGIGEIQYGRTFWTCRRVHEGLWGRGEWFASKDASGGGPLIDLGIHRLDLALFFMGFPEVRSVNAVTTSGIGIVEAQKRGKAYGIEDGGIGLIRFTNGMALELEASYFQNTLDEGQDTILHGSLGSLKLSSETPLLVHDTEGTTPVELAIDETTPKSCVEHFVRVLKGEEELESTPEQGREGLRIVEAMYESAETGKTIEFGA